MRDLHDSDCTIYASLINGQPTDGICTCGYGWNQVRLGDDSKMYSEERLKTMSENQKTNPTLQFLQDQKRITELEAQLAASRAVVAQCGEALEFYANSKDWCECLASGSIGDIEDGEHMMVFQRGESEPWSISESAIAAIRKFEEEKI